MKPTLSPKRAELVCVRALRLFGLLHLVGSGVMMLMVIPIAERLVKLLTALDAVLLALALAASSAVFYALAEITQSIRDIAAATTARRMKQ